uniref:WD repeat-containing protein 3 n=1 Tax=Pseudonaja textilis TaxID=8673 RepID=A0A670ZA30_PSETE
MGLTKQYLRYADAALFGVIASQKGNIAYVTLRGEKGRYVAVPACEHVFLWDTRKGEKILIFQGPKQEVTALCPSPDGLHLVVGYEDGSICLFNLLSAEKIVTFNGHKAAVTVLKFDELGGCLASGSKDTDIIIWDVINESGLYRLKGHKDAITQLLFLKAKNILISSGKDTVVKWWDLDSQHCFKTLVGHRSEVWGFILASEERLLITGSADSELRAWNIMHSQEDQDSSEPENKRSKGHVQSLEESSEDDKADAQDEGQNEDTVRCEKAGSIMREGRNRVVGLAIDRSGRILACHGTDSVLEIFYILSKEEVQKKLEKKMRKARKKAKQKSNVEEEELDISIECSLQEKIQRLVNIKASAKIKSFDLMLNPKGELKATLMLQNNSIECYSLKSSEQSPQVVQTSKINIGGHRTDVRTVSFSSDNIAILSAAAESIKIWNRSTLQCIRTMECNYALCSLFVPGDRQVIIGTKIGKLQLFDLASGCLLETVDAHEGALWSMSLSSNQCGFITGGADKSVKFWEFQLVKDRNSIQKRLSVKQTRILQLDEDVLCVRYSPNQKFLAAALLDCTVKIFYTDTLKFFLSLYGHKLPVLCMDISYDGALIATGSADRNVKIWGLDFGDCHRSLFAHDDSVMYLQFVPKTHLFFTAGKDHKIKQWDADKFEHIQTLEGHHQEVWSLAISPNGDYLVSCSHDKSLRLWERTREPLILEEEKEMVRSNQNFSFESVPGEIQGEAGLAGKKTIETVKAAERIMEAIELYREETAKLEEHKAICKAAGKEVPLPVNPILQAYGNISVSLELEESLLVLPFSYVPDLLMLFNQYLELGLEVELLCRALLFLLRIHFGQITSNQLLVQVMENLKKTTLSRVSQVKDVLGFNIAGLQFLKREIEARDEVTFFADATDRFEEKKRKRKKKQKMILAML